MRLDVHDAPPSRSPLVLALGNINDNDDRHYFIEVNPRIQVEHTVTEQASVFWKAFVLKSSRVSCMLLSVKEHRRLPVVLDL